MNRAHHLLGAVAMTLAVSSAFANNLDSNPDLRQGILNDHSSGFKGTSFPTGKLERGAGDTYGWVVLDVQAGDIRRSAGFEKGQGEAYGSALND